MPSVRATDRIALGAERLRPNMKTQALSGDGQELSFARNMILHAARAAGIAAIDYCLFRCGQFVEGFQNEVQDKSAARI